MVAKTGARKAQTSNSKDTHGQTPSTPRAVPGYGAARPAAAARAQLLYDRIRLGIVSALAVNDTLTFGELKRLLSTTDGNLSVHARKLEEAGYLSCRKEFVDRTPRSSYALTTAGRRELMAYLQHMEALIKTTKC